MSKPLKIILSLFALLVVILVFGWLYLNYAPQKGTDRKKVDMRVEATALFADFCHSALTEMNL